MAPLSSTATSALIQHEFVLRHQRPDIGELLRKSGCNCGFVIFDKLTADFRSKQELIFRITSPSFKYQTEITPEIVSDRRLLPLAVAAIGGCRSGVGWEADLSDFLAGPAGRNLKLLNEAVVTKSARPYYVERFGGNVAAPFTFITALGGSQDQLRFQPAEYRHCGIKVPEWIYVCTEPEHAEGLMRLAKLLSDMGEIPNLTLIVTDGAVPPGVAFNVAVEHATSDQINLVGPNLYPMSAHAKMLSDALLKRIAPGTIQGGLSFYDHATLMHAGIYFDREIFIRRCNGMDEPNVPGNGHLALVRAEHIEKAMPFLAGRWSAPRRVPAIDGMFMRFNKADFEQVNGFCGDFISSYWADADLCLRWSEVVGTVEVNPGIRLLHLDPHGAPLPETRAGWHIDRCFFSEKHKGFLESLSPRTVSNFFPSNLSIGSALERRRRSENANPFN